MPPADDPGPRLRPVSRDQLRDRRRQLRRRRRFRLVLSVWQILGLTGLAVGLALLAGSPLWLIRGPDQVTVTGNRLLSPGAVRELAGLQYPQPVWKWQPQAIAASLKARGPIAEARVSRQLFPASLSVWVRELYPVAVMRSFDPPRPERVGLLDDRGTWLDLERFGSLGKGTALPTLALPTLEVWGNYDQVRSLWPTIYRQLRESPVAIDRLDWRNPAAISLETVLGRVELGSYGDRFPEQIRALSKLQDLNHQASNRQTGAKTLATIDLRNPALPILSSQSASPSPNSSPNASPSTQSRPRPTPPGDRSPAGPRSATTP